MMLGGTDAGESSMKCCSVICLSVCFAVSLSDPGRALGIEAAAKAEQIIALCDQQGILARPGCLSVNLSQKWRYELGYAGQPFSAVGTLAEVRRSLAGNVFAFVRVDEYRVGCKVLNRNAEPLRSLVDRRVLITGVVEGYHMSFDLRRYHHLRLTPYCAIEAVV
jgi:hypothetical protein